MTYADTLRAIMTELGIAKDAEGVAECALQDGNRDMELVVRRAAARSTGRAYEMLAAFIADLYAAQQAAEADAERAALRQAIEHAHHDVPPLRPDLN